MENKMTSKKQMSFSRYLLVLIMLFISFYFAEEASGKSYYINSTTGNDSNNGTGQVTAWKTIAKVSSMSFSPGDSILFNAGNTFSGEIEIDDSGSAGKPITISSYGNGRAMIDAGDGNGVHWVKSSYIVVKDLKIFSSSASNKGNGVLIENNVSGSTCYSVLIENVVAYNFCMSIPRNGKYGCGIHIVGNRSKTGFDGVTIRNCECYNNQYCGISASSSKNLLISDCNIHDNQGNPNYTANWSGSGIQVERCDKGILQKCVVKGNGAANGCAWGPVGIIIVATSNFIVQYCIVCDGKDPKLGDGGGIDIDSGDSCIVQYCYTRNNIGPGFYINPSGEGRTATATNCTFRYNISENDGLNYGAFLANATSGCLIKNTYVYNNTFYKSNSTPGALVRIDSMKNTNMYIYNNIFYTGGNTGLLDQDGEVSSIKYLNNVWYSSTKFVIRYNGSSYNNLSDWYATGQEKDNNNNYGFSFNPLLISPGTGGDGFNTFDGYKLQSGSPCIDAGKVISNNGGKDFWGKLLDSGKPTIGAGE